MSRHALRRLPSWPYQWGAPGQIHDPARGTDHPGYTRAEAEELRAAMPNAAHYEVIELDDLGGIPEADQVAALAGLTTDELDEVGGMP